MEMEMEMREMREACFFTGFCLPSFLVELAHVRKRFCKYVKQIVVVTDEEV